MAADILSYPESFLNPLLKVLVPVLFAIAGYSFWRCRCIYGGKLQVIATLLFLGAIAGILGSVFRLAGDYYTQWKWMESTFMLAFALITVVIAYFIRIKFKNAIRLFGFEPEEGRR